jgi:CRISPR-associated endonuclease/helicase Cas3
MTARQLVNSNMNELSDNDSHVSALTRDGDMSLNLTPFYTNTQGKRCLLNGQLIDALDESDRLEAINLNSVAVPKSWGDHGRLSQADKEGFVWLAMQLHCDGCLSAEQGDYFYFYHSNTGFKRMERTQGNAEAGPPHQP